MLICPGISLVAASKGARVEQYRSRESPVLEVKQIPMDKLVPGELVLEEKVEIRRGENFG
jgi:hypothetical protein